MIINLKIRNFKSIKDEIELSFEAVDSVEDSYIYRYKNQNILKMAIIYGQNASGKTNILKALEFLKSFIINPPIKRDDRVEITPFLFTNNVKQNSYFEIEFLENEIKYLYKLELNKNGIVDEKLYFYNPNRALVYDRNLKKFGSKIDIKKLEEKILFKNTIHNNTLLSGYLKTDITIKEFDDVLSWFKKLMKPIYPRTDLLAFTTKLIKENRIDKDFITNILQNADFAINDFEIKEQEIESEFKEFLQSIGEVEDADRLRKIELFFTHFHKYKLDFQNESSGTQRYYHLSIMLSLMLKESLILSIDELDSSLHPDLLKHFLLTFLVNAKASQLIFTTHSRDLLLEKDILRHDTIWFTEKKEDSSTDLFALSDFDSKIIRKESSLYNIYKQGKLGAVPNLKNYFLDI
jgi:AAA15 family ATPase/GTPase